MQGKAVSQPFRANESGAVGAAGRRGAQVTDLLRCFSKVSEGWIALVQGEPKARGCAWPSRRALEDRSHGLLRRPGGKCCWAGEVVGGCHGLLH